MSTEDMSPTGPLNALSFDVEEYFQVSAFADVVKRDEWENYPSRVEFNTTRVLDLLDEHQVAATFFVLGWVAERYGGLVRDIANRGHEIACHGYSHQLIYNQSPGEFHEETKRSKAILEDLLGGAVRGYRAASYSITKKSLWALETLVELGFEYDSSIFPITHDRYGIADAPRAPHIAQVGSGGRLVEFPMSTAKMLGMNVPICGGGYFRLLPYAFTKAGLRKINRDEKRSFVFYLHPWEVDPDQPRIKASALSRFRHYNRLGSTYGNLQKLVQDFRFATMAQVLDGLGDDLTVQSYTAG